MYLEGGPTVCFANGLNIACKKKRSFKMATIIGLNKWKNGVAVSCKDGELGGADFGGKDDDTIL